MKKIDEYLRPTKENTQAFNKVQKAIKDFSLDDQSRILACSLSNVMIKDYGKNYDTTGKPHPTLMGNRFQFFSDAIDHPCKLYGNPSFEPYGLTYSNLKELMTWCEVNGFEIQISSESPHFPGRTLLVSLYEVSKQL